MVIVTLRLDYTLTSVIFMGVPSAYFTARKSSIALKTIVFSIIVTCTIVPAIDYVAHVSSSWFESTGLTGVRLLGVFPADVLLWGFMYSYFIISFYEYFCDRDRNKQKFSKKIKAFTLMLAVCSVLFCAILLVDSSLLVIPYFYAISLSLLFITPLIVILSRHPALTRKVVFIGAYFVVLSAIYEITALLTGQWMFPGDYYILSFTVFALRFPMEEILWILFVVPSYICIYEFFADDLR